MTTLPWLNKDELLRINHFRNSSPRMRQEMIKVFKVVVRNTERDDIKKASRRLINLMERRKG